MAEIERRPVSAASVRKLQSRLRAKVLESPNRSAYLRSMDRNAFRTLIWKKNIKNLAKWLLVSRVSMIRAILVQCSPEDLPLGGGDQNWRPTRKQLADLGRIGHGSQADKWMGAFGLGVNDPVVNFYKMDDRPVVERSETVTQEPRFLASMYEDGMAVIKNYNPRECFYEFISEYDCHTHEKVAFVLGKMNRDLLNAIATRSLANKAKLEEAA